MILLRITSLDSICIIYSTLYTTTSRKFRYNILQLHSKHLDFHGTTTFVCLELVVRPHCKVARSVDCVSIPLGAGLFFSHPHPRDSTTAWSWEHARCRKSAYTCNPAAYGITPNYKLTEPVMNGTQALLIHLYMKHIYIYTYIYIHVYIMYLNWLYIYIYIHISQNIYIYMNIHTCI